jgi:hypothetical protein
MNNSLQAVTTSEKVHELSVLESLGFSTPSVCNDIIRVVL